MIKVNDIEIDHTETWWVVEYADKTWGQPRFMDVDDETMAHAYASLLDGKVKTRTVFVGKLVDFNA